MGKKLTKEEFTSIIFDDISWEIPSKTPCCVIAGLKIIEKYIPNKRLVGGTDHDMIYSVSVDDIINAGITQEDVVKLRNLGWNKENDYLCKYV